MDEIIGDISVLIVRGRTDDQSPHTRDLAGRAGVKELVMNALDRDFEPDRSATGEGNDYKYTGQEWDEEVGLYNYKARMYDPELGRFTSTDPAGQQWGPYTYVYNNPLVYTDPTGTIAIWDDLGGGGVAFSVSMFYQMGIEGASFDVAFRRSLKFAGSAVIYYNLGGGSPFKGNAVKQLGYKETVQLSAALGGYSAAYDYTADAAYGNGAYSMNNLRSNWDAGEFAYETTKGAAISAAFSAVSWQVMDQYNKETLLEAQEYLADPNNPGVNSVNGADIARGGGDPFRHAEASSKAATAMRRKYENTPWQFIHRGAHDEGFRYGPIHIVRDGVKNTVHFDIHSPFDPMHWIIEWGAVDQGYYQTTTPLYWLMSNKLRW